MQSKHPEETDKLAEVNRTTGEVATRTAAEVSSDRSVRIFEDPIDRTSTADDDRVKETSEADGH